MDRCVRASSMDRIALMACDEWRGNPIADLAMLKVQASKTMELCAREAMQILGGAGYLRGNSGPARVRGIYKRSKS